ncbi:methyltransferase [Leucobacter sp. wl10]|uniref:RraA family protein n=1 Tax=Leucobacter sp. wl10 TaxID=2304677 RepID=UPI000E5C0843|nr:methyltransferase [Leucobacter sp. wl10]RGE19620.1 methyltransferase [Leucobacter sp. wl10]
MNLHQDSPAPWEALRGIPVANIGDAVDRLGLADSGIAPVWRGATLVGPAFTVWTREGDNLGIHEAIAAAPAGSVIVVNAAGFTSRALLGELMAGRAHQRGIAGFVVDGAVRDAGELGRLRIPVFARGISPAGPYKNGPFRNQVPVALGGVSVSPGDIIAGDDDGVAVVPASDLGRVAAAARAVREDENQRREKIWSAS